MFLYTGLPTKRCKMLKNDKFDLTKFDGWCYEVEFGDSTNVSNLFNLENADFKVK